MDLVWRTILAISASLASAVAQAAEPVPRSVLILNQSNPDTTWYPAFSSAFQKTLTTKATAPISVYAEHLDLNRFSGERHDEVVHAFIRGKYRDRPIGVIVAQGAAALDFVVRWRTELLPGAPVVFASVDEPTLARLRLPPNVTGATYQLTFRDAVAAAKILVPGLRRIALVGDPLEAQPTRKHFVQEIPVFAGELEIIDLMNLPMAELRRRVAVLPADTAIIYTVIVVDGAGVAYLPFDSLAAVAEVANRPIVIDIETLIGRGGTGGFVASAHLIGADAAQRTLRILDGEDASSIPITKGSFIRPIFDWQQLQRFEVSESHLPPGSDIRFRVPGIWEQYRGQMIAIFSAFLLQAAMITWLLFEHRRRRLAEVESRRRLLEVIHLNRTAAAGALSASFAHELNQPLTAILTNAQTAEELLSANPPDLEEVKEILGDIRRDDQRAAEVINHLRGLLKRHQLADLQEFDLNEAVREAALLLRSEATTRGVVLGVSQAQTTLRVRADEVHLQQVVLNLVMNGMDAMLNCLPGSRRIGLETALVGEAEAVVSVSDSGTGIPNDKLKEIFETFYTTKPQGTGLGLSIARTIIETYGGRIWAENRTDGGAVFRFTLPLAKTQTA